MRDIERLLAEFPPGVRERLEAAWQGVPAGGREQLENALRALPGDLGGWRSLVRLATAHVRMVAGRKRRIAIVGPANVGKSTLYNQLVREPGDEAEVSPVPGTTRESRSADAGLFDVIDTPGADAVGTVGEAEKERALQSAEEADFLVVVFDAVEGIRRGEQALFSELQRLGKAHVVVLNKIDTVARGRARERVVASAAANLGLATEQVVACSARQGKNLDRVLLAVAKADPEIVGALGEALPAYRNELAWAATSKAAATAAAIAVTPLPVLDVFPLLAVQSSLVLGIARIYGERLTWVRARELVATFGLGMAGRTLFGEISKLGGPPGWLLAAAIASSTTVVMGRSAAVWFERGTRARASELRAESRRLARRLVASLGRLGRRPKREAVRDAIEAEMERDLSGGAESAGPSGSGPGGIGRPS